MKKGVLLIWDETCQQAFEDLKKYLMKPPMLATPILGKPLLTYVRTMDHSPGAMLAQTNELGHKQAIYYFSRTILGTKHMYTSVGKECLDLVFAVQKI